MLRGTIGKVSSFPKKLVGFGVIFILLLIISPFMFGINKAGERTVVQWPTGNLFVKFTPGPYIEFFGATEIYKDIITMDFDKEFVVRNEKISHKQGGISVRYQDGGTGTIYGKARFGLPNDEVTMIKVHKEFRSHLSVTEKLIKPLIEEAMNLTAGLMTSEDGYTNRNEFTKWSEQQVKHGKFVTILKESSKKDEVTGKIVVYKHPEPVLGDDGLIKQFPSDLKSYGIVVSSYQITDWDFEPKTLEQIATKREATMGIITAKANAERAKQDAITTEEIGKANVVKAKYEKEVEKERAVVDAEKLKEVAIIQAEQLVKVAEQKKLEAEQKKLAAVEYEKEQVLRGKGDAAYKQMVLEADGALAQKLHTYENVMKNAFEELGKQKWVPEIQMGGKEGATGGQVSDFMSLFMTKVAKDLALDMSVPTKGRNK